MVRIHARWARALPPRSPPSACTPASPHRSWNGGRTGGIAQDITQHEGSLVYVVDGGEDTRDALTAVGPSQDWGVTASWVFSRLFSGRGWMRGLDVEGGENRG